MSGRLGSVPTSAEVTVRYLLMIYGDEAGYEAATEEQREALRNEYGRVAAGWGSRLQGGDELAASTSATTVRVRSEEQLATDGPFAETKEQLGGYYIVDVREPGRRRSRRAGELPAAKSGAGRGPAPHRHVSEAAEVVDRLFRRESGRAVATLIRVLGDFDLAEEAVQEACDRPWIVAPGRGARQPGRLDHDDGPQPRDRPSPAGPAAAATRPKPPRRSATSRRWVTTCTRSPTTGSD